MADYNPTKKICACCAEGSHISLCHNVRWADAGFDCECGCVASAEVYRNAGYTRAGYGPAACQHSEWFAEGIRENS